MGGLVLGDISHPTESLYCFFPVRAAPEGSRGPSCSSWGWLLGGECYTWELPWHVGRGQTWGVHTGHESKLQLLKAGSKGEEKRNEDRHVAEES